MKKIVLVLVLFNFIFFRCNTGDNKGFVGTWEIVEFRLDGQVQDPGRNEEYLRNKGAVWDMKFSKNGKFEQNFNMRSPDMKMEMEKGTWLAVNDTLKIEIQFDTITSKLEYTYELNDGILTLTFAAEEMGSNLITKFREK